MKRILNGTFLGSAIFFAAFVFAFLGAAAPASAFACPEYDPTGSIFCPGNPTWCGNTCQDEPTCPIAPDTQKTKLFCSSCLCGCPDDKPNICSGTYICQKNNTTCDPLNKVSVCSGSADTMACGGCKTNFTMCPGDLCKSTTSASCPPPAMYDPCTEKCVEKYLLTKASYALPTTTIPQDVDIQAQGSINLAGGDINLSSTKSISVNGPGQTVLNVGNWLNFPTPANTIKMVVFGSLYANGFSTLSGDTTSESETVETNKLCLGKATPVCRDYWPLGLPESATLNSTLRYDGASWVASTHLTNDNTNVGIGTATPTKNLDIFGSGNHTILRINETTGGAWYVGESFSRFGDEKWFIGMDNTASGDLVFRRNGSDNPVKILAADGTLEVAGFKMPTGAADKYVMTSDAAGVGTWKNLVGLPETAVAGDTLRYTGTNWVNNNILYNNGARIGIRDNAPGYVLDIAGNATDLPVVRLSGTNSGEWTGLRLDRAKGTEKWFVGMEADDNLHFRHAGAGAGEVIIDQNGSVGVGTVPAAGIKLDVSGGAVRASTWTNMPSPTITANMIIEPASGTGVFLFPQTNSSQTFTIQDSVGDAVFSADTTNQRVSVGSINPGFPLEVSSAGGTSIIRLDNHSAAPKLWTGLRLDRARDAEQWYMGMDATTEDLLFRNVSLGATDALKNTVRISATDGTLQANKFRLNKPTALNNVMISDASGNADWAYMLAADDCTGGKLYKITTTSYNGSQGGYNGMNAICRGAEADERQHVCTPDEIMRSYYCLGSDTYITLALWNTLFSGQSAWIASGPPGFTTPAVNDCNGWTTTTGYAGFWSFDANGGIGYATACVGSWPVACCKP